MEYGIRVCKVREYGGITDRPETGLLKKVLLGSFKVPDSSVLGRDWLA